MTLVCIDNENYRQDNNNNNNTKENKADRWERIAPQDTKKQYSNLSLQCMMGHRERIN